MGQAALAFVAFRGGLGPWENLKGYELVPTGGYIVRFLDVSSHFE